MTAHARDLEDYFEVEVICVLKLSVLARPNDCLCMDVIDVEKND
jgi:hypothetical protein